MNINELKTQNDLLKAKIDSISVEPIVKEEAIHERITDNAFKIISFMNLGETAREELKRKVDECHEISSNRYSVLWLNISYELEKRYNIDLEATVRTYRKINKLKKEQFNRLDALERLGLIENAIEIVDFWLKKEKKNAK